MTTARENWRVSIWHILVVVILSSVVLALATAFPQKTAIDIPRIISLVGPLLTAPLLLSLFSRTPRTTFVVVTIGGVFNLIWVWFDLFHIVAVLILSFGFAQECSIHP